MTPQQKPNHHRIVISYLAVPPGQVGARPRVIPRNNTFEFVSNDEGTLTVEFIGSSPLASGAMTADGGQTLTAANPGHYFVKCRLVQPNGQPVVLDPTAPGGPGGEIEIPPV